MNQKAALFAFALLASATLSGQQPAPPAVFTAAQAQAGRVAYENGCGRCHTYTLLGRKGDPSELPRADSLPSAYQKFIGNPNHVPPLVGKAFLSRWGTKTVAEIVDNFQRTSKTPIFELNMDEATVVNITAYILQMNGAKPGNQPLTAATSAVVNSLVE